MKDLLKNLAEMVKVKTVITLVLLAVYGYLAITGVVNAGSVENLLLMAVSFYFGTQHEKKGGSL